MKIITLSVAFVCLLTSFVVHSTPIPRINGPINIDGQLTESAWEKAPTQSLPYVVIPFNINTLPVKTEVKYFEDGQNLNIAFVAEIKDRSQLRAFYRERDNIWEDDMVGVKIDPYNDQKLAFQFFVNPLGVQSDATENTISGTESAGWDAIWYSEGTITDSHYTVEMSIPLNNFNFPESSTPQTWAFEFVRFHQRDITYRLSSVDIDPDNYCWVCQMAPLEGFAGLESGSNLLLIPTLVSGRSESRDMQNSWQSTQDTQTGLDLKWGFNSTSSLNVTLNPDFSQVEADSGQLNVNDNFTLYFEEKRPFFLENIDIFQTLAELLYTRNITAPNLGVKVSGREGQHAYGIFAADDEVTTIVLPGNRSSDTVQLAQSSKNLGVRYRYDVNNDLSVGSLSTMRHSDGYHNAMTSVDIRYYLGDQDSFVVQAMVSDSEYSQSIRELYNFNTENCEQGQCVAYEHFLRTPEGESFTGHGTVVSYSHREQDWFTDIEYFTISDGFRADLGFMDQVDVEALDSRAGLNFYADESSLWNKISLQIGNDVKFSRDGQIISRESEIDIVIEGTLNSQVVFGCEIGGQIGNRLNPAQLSLRDNVTYFDLSECSIRGGFTPYSGLSIDGRYVAGETVDLDNNRVADRKNARVSADYFVNEHLSTRVQVVNEVLFNESGDIYDAKQLDVRLSYNFDVRHALRLNVVYTDIQYTPSQYRYYQPDNVYEDLGTQLIYSYKVNPQTAIYMGYSDAAFGDDFQDLLQVQKNFFAKFSYAWMP